MSSHVFASGTVVVVEVVDVVDVVTGATQRPGIWFGSVSAETVTYDDRQHQARDADEQQGQHEQPFGHPVGPLEHEQGRIAPFGELLPPARFVVDLVEPPEHQVPSLSLVRSASADRSRPARKAGRANLHAIGFER